MGSAPHSDDEQSLADVEGEPCELLDDVDEDQAELSVQAHSPERAVRIKGVVVDHHTFVWRSLVRLGVPRADAEDALQQVFMVTARRIDDIAPGSERSFLYGVCLRVASRARRTVARRREVVGEDACPERVDTAARPDEMLDRARARALLDDILTTMPIELRAVFTLFELEQLTMSEIATLIGVPQGTVASRLRRARELFAEQRKRIEARMRSARSATIDRAAAPTARIGLTEGEGT
ncbi:MAG: sigma-70 family RNA polymerase sigma factor [Polyangiaceae bacterium]|nr:sigma-70 family RNA polymerase sigma factor [Polyangiaceae bacterium]